MEGFMTLYRRQGARSSPRKRNANKQMAEKALQIAEKGREAKGKGEEERHIPFECRVSRKTSSVINAKK